jgi:hypothetical protein
MLSKNELKKQLKEMGISIIAGNYICKADIEKVVAAKKDYAGKLISYVKDKINLDLKPLLHEKQPKPKLYLAVDMKYDSFSPSKELRSLLELEKAYKHFFKIESNGGLGIALMYGPKIKDLAEGKLFDL